MNGLVEAFVDSQAALRASLYKRLGDEDDVLDVLQEVFLRVSELRTGAGVSDPARYLHRMAMNMATDRLRQKTRQARLFRSSGDIGAEVGDARAGPDPERIARDRQRLRRMQAVLDRLPENCRQAFLMSRCDGLSYDEIGRRMGVSRNMVKKHLVKALALLRTEMPRLR